MTHGSSSSSRTCASDNEPSQTLRLASQRKPGCGGFAGASCSARLLAVLTTTRTGALVNLAILSPIRSADVCFGARAFELLVAGGVVVVVGIAIIVVVVVIGAATAAGSWRDGGISVLETRAVLEYGACCAGGAVLEAPGNRLAAVFFAGPWQSLREGVGEAIRGERGGWPPRSKGMITLYDGTIAVRCLLRFIAPPATPVVVQLGLACSLSLRTTRIDNSSSPVATASASSISVAVPVYTHKRWRKQECNR